MEYATYHAVRKSNRDASPNESLEVLPVPAIIRHMAS